MSKTKKMPNIPFEAFVFYDAYLTNSACTLKDDFDPKYIANLEDLNLQTFTSIEHYEVIGIKLPEGKEEKLFRTSFSYGARWLEADDRASTEGSEKKSDEDSQTAQATIEATFICEYKLKIDDPEKISKEAYSLFSRNIGAMETWPYWREFLNSQITRMHLTGVRLPKRRRPDEPDFG